MFLLLSLPPAILAAALLGGRISRVFEHRWRAVWLIWLSLGIQIPLFTARAEEALGRELIGIIHIGTYIPLLVFLALNRNAGLGLVIAGALANLAAITANGGAMPVDPKAWKSAFPDKLLEGGDQRNTSVTGDHVLQTFGDIMALPPGHWFSNAFSIGDVLLALGLAYCFARLSLGSPALDRASVARYVAGSRREDSRLGWRDVTEFPALCLAGAAVAATAVVAGAVSRTIAENASAIGIGEAGLIGLILALGVSMAIGQVSAWSLLRARESAPGATALSLLGCAAALGLLAQADLAPTVVGGVALFGVFAGAGVATMQCEIAAGGLGPAVSRGALLATGGAATVGLALAFTGLPVDAGTVLSGAQALMIGGVALIATVVVGAGLSRRIATSA